MKEGKLGWDEFKKRVQKEMESMPISRDEYEKIEQAFNERAERMDKELKEKKN